MRGHNQKSKSGEKLSRHKGRGGVERSNDQIKQLIEASPVAMVITSGKEQRVELVNGKFVELFGYTIKEVPDVSHWWSLAYPNEAYREEIKARWQTRVEKAIQEKSEIEPMEAIVTCKDGSQRVVESRLSSIGEKHVVTFFDLTKRIQTENALQEREKHSQSLLRLSRRLERAQTYADVLNAARDEIRSIIGYQNLWAYLFTADKDYAHALIAGGPQEEEVMKGEGIATLTIRGDRMLEEIAEAKEIVVVEDARVDERTDKKIVARLGNRTIVNVPILLFDRHLGSIGTGTFGDEGVRPPTNSEREYLSALASHMAIAFDQIHLFGERKKAEEELRKNNALLERIFSTTEFLVAYLDANFDILRVNRAYAESDQQDPEFFRGRNHFDLYPNAENEAIFRRVVETGEPYVAYAKPFEYAEHPERGISYWNWTLQPVKEADGRVSGLVMSLIDVTEREQAFVALQESEERYRALVQQASDGIFIADPQGNYIDVNPSGCAMLGYSREEILKMNMRDLASAETQAKSPLRFAELRSGKSITSERTLVAKSGALLPVEISSKALDTGNFLGIVRDITERKRHELEREAVITVSAALRQALTRAEIINVILDQLLQLFNADGTMIALPHLENKEIVIETGRGIIGERFTNLRIPLGVGISGWVIEKKTSYLNNRANEDPRFYRPDLLGDSHCVASVPLIALEYAIGALWIIRRAEISEGDLHLLNAIADIAASAIHRVTLHEQMEQQLQHLIALHQIDLAISANFDLKTTLNVILRNVMGELGLDAANVLLLNPVTHTLDYADGTGFWTRSIEDSHVGLEDGYAGRAAQENCAVSCFDLQGAADTFSRSSLLADEKFVTYIASPLVSKGQIKGVLEVFTRKRFQPGKEWYDYFDTLVTQAAIAIESASLFENLQRSNMELMLAYDATIEGWSLALDLRDKETEGHTRRVTEMALNLAAKMGMTEAEKLNIKRGALLHDIGKMGVPDSILHKDGPLTSEEWNIMRQHPEYAFHMLRPIAYLRGALTIPYCHHERWDGSGYPRGFKGEEIPLAARVFAVVDVFDALTSDRPYREALSDEEAYRYIGDQAGKQFDPEIVKIFLESR